MRERFALIISDIVKYGTSEKLRDEIFTLYDDLVRDSEPEVRTICAKSFFKCSQNLLESYKNQSESEDKFEKYFIEKVLPQLHSLLTDPEDKVRIALSSNMCSLSAVLRDECFNENILPLVAGSLEHEDSMIFKENMLKNFNSLPIGVDITKSLKSIDNVMKNILETSQKYWRTRRNLVLTFAHISKNCSRDFFDQNLKMFYLNLLSDPVFAVRRTSPLILPLLAKQFGMNWAKNSLIPVFVIFSKDNRYLYRYVSLYAITELICPTLYPHKGNYLQDLQEFISDSKDSKAFIELLLRIKKLNEKLIKALDDDCFNDILSEPDGLYDNTPQTENIGLYAEDTLEALKKNHVKNVFSFDKSEINNTYLTGVLLVLITEFVNILKLLIQDPMDNIRKQTKWTLKQARKFCVDIKKEIDQPWAVESLKILSEDDIKKIESELDEELITNNDKGSSVMFETHDSDSDKKEHDKAETDDQSETVNIDNTEVKTSPEDNMNKKT